MEEDQQVAVPSASASTTGGVVVAQQSAVLVDALPYIDTDYNENARLAVSQSVSQTYVA